MCTHRTLFLSYHQKNIILFPLYLFLPHLSYYVSHTLYSSYQYFLFKFTLPTSSIAANKQDPPHLLPPPTPSLSPPCPFPPISSPPSPPSLHPRLLHPLAPTDRGPCSLCTRRPRGGAALASGRETLALHAAAAGEPWGPHQVRAAYVVPASSPASCP